MSAELYAESSAVLSWLLGQPEADSVREAMASAEIVVASELTLIECHRVLHRAVALGELADAIAAELRAHLSRAAGHWVLFRLEPEISERAQRSFPREPVRTLDAIHLATALSARALLPSLSVLALDRRVRSSAAELGFDLLPPGLVD